MTLNTDVIADSINDIVPDFHGSTINHSLYRGLLDRYAYPERINPPRFMEPMPYSNSEYYYNPGANVDFQIRSEISDKGVEYTMICVNEIDTVIVANSLDKSFWTGVNPSSEAMFGSAVFMSPNAMHFDYDSSEAFWYNESIVWDNLIWPKLMGSREFALSTISNNFMLPIFPTIGVFAPIIVEVSETTGFVKYSYHHGFSDANFEIGGALSSDPLTFNQLRKNWVTWFKSRGSEFGGIESLIGEDVLKAEKLFQYAPLSEQSENEHIKRLATAYLTNGDGVPDTLAHAGSDPADVPNLGWNGP